MPIIILPNYGASTAVFLYITALSKPNVNVFWSLKRFYGSTKPETRKYRPTPRSFNVPLKNTNIVIYSHAMLVVNVLKDFPLERLVDKLIMYF